LDIRCFPYVVFYMGSVQATFGSVVSNTYEGVRWADHADWYERDPSGNTRFWQFGTDTDGVGVSFSDPLVVCPNVQGYQDAMVAWVDYVMGQGADGVYVDVISGRDACWGEQLGFHKHLIADDPANFPKGVTDASANQNQAFALLLKKARQTVKRHRPDGFVWGNSGNPLGLTSGFSTVEEFQQYLDGDTMEGYICAPDASGNIIQSTTWGATPALRGINLAESCRPILGKASQSWSSVISDRAREAAKMLSCAMRALGWPD
jgi:hypothetical protein